MADVFVALAVYITYESGSTLIRHETSEQSIPGIMVAVVIVIGGRKTPGRCRDRESSDDRRFETGRLLRLPVSDSVAGLLLNALFSWWCPI